MAYLYILKSEQYPKTYVGITEDLIRRLEEHDKGFSDYSSKYRPWKLVYQENYANMIEAHKRELYFKSAAGRRFIKKNNIIPR